MTEDKAALLEQKRFVINPESGEEMQRLRSTLRELKKDFPFLSGLGFFGSRTKGTENFESDYDLYIFYNSDRMNTSPEDFTESAGTIKRWSNIIDLLEQKLHLNFDNRIRSSTAGLRVDISPTRTDNDIEMFMEVAKPFLLRDIDDEVLYQVSVPPTQNLFARFHLVVGEEVYKNRQYILDKLKADPNGDRYFQILMKSLAWFEREHERYPKPTTPPYKGYPQTIEEAEKYFLTR